MHVYPIQSKNVPHVLVVDDDASSLASIAELVKRQGCTTSTAATLMEARRHISNKPPDVVLTNLELPDGNGLDLLQELQPTAGSEVILLTGHTGAETAAAALNRGASDYLTKPIDSSRLKSILENVARVYDLADRIRDLCEEACRGGHFGRLIGRSTPMQEVYELIARVAPTEASVLVTGESGTGKELVAETLHELSRRSKGPFVAVNCGAISPTLIESELFGHERGSFTGASRTHKGHFERARGGTLFLDEITEMPIELQVKLLRVLETRKLDRVGGEQQVSVEVRVIAATNHCPEEAVAEGKLRKDLLYRLNVFPLTLPSLRSRGDDIELLAEHFLQLLNRTEGTAKRLSRAALQRLREYHWPGNVRELSNVLHRAFILADEEIGPDGIPAEGPFMDDASGSPLDFRVGISIAEAERRLIMATLEYCGGEKKRAAGMLGVSLKTLYNRLNSYRATPR
jgi:DNA-binding NtrC family response regulator